VPVGGEEVKLQIWDTAGQERFRRSMIKHYYRNVHAVVFVYDVTKMSSFENLPHWISECNHNCVDHSALRILIGNKNDMMESRAVSSSMARKFAEFHEMEFYETSAKDDQEYTHVSDIFAGIALRLQTDIIKSGGWWSRSGVTDNRAVTANSKVVLSHNNITRDETATSYCCW
jgi:small GTP-binding protein